MGDYPEAGTQKVEGRLRLHFSPDREQQTRLMVREQRPPLQVIRAFPISTGGALVHIHNISGGVLGGDRLSLEVEVEPGAHAQLTSTGATRLYRSRPGVPAAQQTGTITVRYHQHMHIELDSGAGLFWWETVAPGRVAQGEQFAYEQLLLELHISTQGRSIAIERLKLEPHCRALSSLARLGPYSHFCSFYICRVGLEAIHWSTLEKELGALAQELSCPGEISWGVSTLVAHGLVMRAVSRQGRDIPPGLLACWRAAKRYLYDEEPVPPRKIY